jgi:hypothetical protein
MVSKHVITRRWQIGRYFITYYAKHPTFSQKRRQTKGIVYAPTIPVVPYFNPTSFALSSTLFVT